MMCATGRERRKSPARARNSSRSSVRCQSSGRMVGDPWGGGGVGGGASGRLCEVVRREVGHRDVTEAPVEGVAGRVGEVGEEEELVGAAVEGCAGDRGGDGGGVAAAAEGGRG